MRSLLFIFATSGILAGCHSQPQAQQPGTQIGQSTAPLPPDPTNVQPLQEPGQAVPMPQPVPQPGDVGSPPKAPLPAPVPNDAGVADPDAGSQPPVYVPPDGPELP